MHSDKDAGFLPLDPETLVGLGKRIIVILRSDAPSPLGPRREELPWGVVLG